MQHPRILLQLDSDRLASVFDAVVAVDSGVEHLLQYSGVDATNVVPIVHGAIFTRGPDTLHNTALFIGGSDVSIGEAVGREIQSAFFEPMRVSVMLDGNGSNTTAAAAVLCASRHIELADSRALVMGGTGPVGTRIARLLLQRGAKVSLGSRSPEKAEAACQSILEKIGAEYTDRLQAVDQSPSVSFEQATIVFGCGAAGIPLVSQEQLALAENLKVAVDLNAVPPAGIAGIAVTDKAVCRDGRTDYGAIGVGGLKMKIHRAAIQQLFGRNDLFLDTEEIFEIGQKLG